MASLAVRSNIDVEHGEAWANVDESLIPAWTGSLQGKAMIASDRNDGCS